MQTCKDPNWDSACVCEQQKQKIDWVLKQGQPLTSFDWSKTRANPLVLIGDTHGVTNPDSILRLAALARSNQGPLCALFEFSSSWPATEFLKLLRTKSKDEKANQLRRYYRKIAENLKQTGFKIFTVDNPRAWTGDRKVSDLERDIHMAQRISDLISKGTCKQAILVVGKAHISRGDLTNSLKSHGLTFLSLNPIHEPHGGHTAPTEEWNGICRGQVYNPPEPTIFESTGIRDAWVSPGFDQDRLKLRFGSFDYSILFPEPHFEKEKLSDSSPAESQVVR